MSGDPNLTSSSPAMAGVHWPKQTVSQSTLYDAPDNSEGGIAMEETFASPMTSPGLTSNKAGVYMSLNTPDMHDSEDPSLSGTRHGRVHHHAKRFDQKSTRKHLFKTGSLTLFITIFFGAAMCVCLKAWEGFREPIVLSKKDVRWFNSLTLGLSLCLGLNLLASLRNYASFLRWSFLSRRYMSLEAFELILGSGSLLNVTKLMFISFPLFRHRKFPRRFGWFKDVRREPSRWTWFVCLIWLLINIGSQVLVALISLFFPMETSHIPLMVYGDVSVADLTQWHPEIADNGIATGFEAAWMYGMEAMVYPEFAVNETQTDLSGLPGTPVYKGDGYWDYQFFLRDPLHPFKNYVGSNRRMRAVVTCDQLEVRDGVVLDGTGMYIEGRETAEQNFTKYALPEMITGAMSWIAAVPEFCGPRCTNFTVLQSNDSSVIERPSLFLCNSTVPDVVIQDTGKRDIVMRNDSEKKPFFGTDKFARIAAGAMGWTGVESDGWDDRQFRSYTQGSKWSPAHTVSAQEVEDLLMRFTIGAIGAFDDHGIRFNMTNQHARPIQGQQLEVDWPYILCILGSICFIQLAALCCLLVFANRAVVRDNSLFSLAMLLSPVVGRIGKAGMNMSGDEIKEHPKLRWKKIRYDYREGKDGEPNQVDIFFEGRDSKESRKSWAPGVYR
jgi:hypothetical protein